ncbi:MAG: carbon storage regulator [Planctomycetota bacterium]|nr:MAG: carbon storage regulator [Planctomycetota bacterium]REJ88636.1 MAG: carbon storage regulator [Planctomycetota bacterium]REK27213.1 MAG: carbon storage regulator [Planctomycetota bacterium]REK36765.1 MAG: carbon storage regulator [Planctomycetota bacterium]
MLVLTRKANESILIGDNIELTVVEVRGNRVKLGIVAPRTVPVLRQEVAHEVHQNRPAVATGSPGGRAKSMVLS